MPESTIRPARLAIRKQILEGQITYMYVYIRDNVSKKTVKDVDGNLTTLYVYDEQQVRVAIPQKLGNLKSMSRSRGKRIRDAIKSLANQHGAQAVDRRDGLKEIRGDPNTPPLGTIISILTNKNNWSGKKLPVL